MQNIMRMQNIYEKAKQMRLKNETTLINNQNKSEQLLKI